MGVNVIVGAALLAIQAAPVCAQSASQVWLGPGETALLSVKEIGMPPCLPADEPPLDAERIGPCEFRKLLREALNAEAPKPALQIRDAELSIDATYALRLTVRSLDPGVAAADVPFLVQLSLLNTGKVYTARVPGLSVVVLWTRDRFAGAPRSALRKAVRSAAQELLGEFASDLAIARVVEK